MGLRTRQEGAVGLLILAGLGLFGGLILWIQSVGFGQQRYRVTIEFEDAKGMQVGAVLRYRGVEIGQAVAVRPTSRAVEVDVDISQANLRISSDAIVAAQSAALLGEKYMDLVAQAPLDNEENLPLPLDPACNPEVIICEGSRLVGIAPADLTDLIRSSNQIAELFTNPLILAALEEFAQGAGEATGSIKGITDGVAELTTSLNTEIGTLGNTLTSVGNAADEIQVAASGIQATASEIQGATAEARSILEENRSTISTTLQGLGQASDRLTVLMGNLNPAVQEIAQGEILENLDVLTQNLRQTSAQLLVAGRALNSPENVQVLQELLDSARTTFQNTQKITTDLDDLTGDPALRNDLRQLLQGMGQLFGAAEQLDQEVQALRLLSPNSPPAPRPTWVSDQEWRSWRRDVVLLQRLLDEMDAKQPAAQNSGNTPP